KDGGRGNRGVDGRRDRERELHVIGNSLVHGGPALDRAAQYASAVPELSRALREPRPDRAAIRKEPHPSARHDHHGTGRPYVGTFPWRDRSLLRHERNR